jgi:subtilase family serine protease
MTPWHPLDRWSAGSRVLADWRPAWIALIAATALLALLAPGPAYAARSLARTTDALTGFGDAAQLSARNVCRPATRSRSTCDARMLVTSSGAPVHPRLARPGAADVAQRTTTADARSAAVARISGPAAAAEPQPGTPAYMQQAYDLSYLSQYGGVSDTVAIVDAYDDPSSAADLATYRAFFGLPACTSANGCFRKVDQDGGQSFPSQAPGWAAEISLDLDAVSALCPRCNIILVEANSDNSEDLATAQAEAASLGANQITDSWGDPATLVPSGSFTFPGIATVAASGDQGYLGPLTNQYPAALPDVTAAGGTALVPASTSGTENARGFTEQAWSSAGSGCDLLAPKPSWQSDGGCSGRTYSDLSANANPQTGLDVYDSGDGGWLVMGGTSESAPLIAAYYAITGAGAASPEWAYAHSALLNAPVGGSNGSCAISIAYICLTGLGYSGPTGVGSISGAVTPGAPGIGGPGTTGSYTQGTAPTSAQVQAGVYPNGSDTAYWWQYGTTTSYGQTTVPVDAGSGQAPVTISSNLAGLAPDTTYHYRLVARNSFGNAYGYDFTFKTGDATGEAVTSVKATGPKTARVRGTVDVANGSTAYHFVYGTSGSYRHGTSSQTVWGSGTTTVAATLTGLAPHTTYHVRLVASSGHGLLSSPPRTFTTGQSTGHGTRRRRSRRH